MAIKQEIIIKNMRTADGFTTILFPTNEPETNPVNLKKFRIFRDVSRKLNSDILINAVCCVDWCVDWSIRRLKFFTFIKDGLRIKIEN